MIGIEWVVTQSQVGLANVIKDGFDRGPILTNLGHAHGALELDDAVLGSFFAGIGPHPFCFMPELLFHQDAGLQKQFA